ncbi:MAG: UDP-glucose 4-epimerase, partial [Achromobacter sp.]|nr:UDP-glucose 4-epimerase [Achromobacter sp.]
YVHVVDLARGHIVALAELGRKQGGGFTVNLGTGRGYSVLEVIAAFERASGRQVPYEFTERRSGDVAVYYAATGMARALLGWEARLDLDRMCEDAWRWQRRNPSGYRSA